eukprot:Gb_00039 [translate_table: standard]
MRGVGEHIETFQDADLIGSTFTANTLGVIYVHRNEDVVNFGAHNLDGDAEDENDLKHNKSEAGHLSKKREDSKKSPSSSHLKSIGGKVPLDLANQKEKENKKSVVNGKVGAASQEKLGGPTSRYPQYVVFKAIFGGSTLERMIWGFLYNMAFVVFY